MLAMLMSAALCAEPSSEQPTARYLEKIKDNPQKLRMFLQKMPKGGDLHNHTGGASMAENMIRYASSDHLCIDRKTLSAIESTQCKQEDLLDDVSKDPALYNSLIDAWSMRNFVQTKESGHDHFFSSFNKFQPILFTHSGEILAEITDHAGQQNELYLELMVTPELASFIGDKVGWDSDLAALRNKLLDPKSGLQDLVIKVSKDLDADEIKKQQILACDSSKPKAGCHVKVRYLFQILREQEPVQVFAQLLAGFEAATQDKRIVGINMVQPEDGYISMRDYKLHMQMVGFLHTLYPKVHISLHAGELNNHLVPHDGLRFHIRDAVKVAHAERIGHGVDIAYEDHADELMREMASKNIMVEINLSSNAAILGVEGKNHPLLLYMEYHVPVALSTDDEGILRTDLTEQYKKAIMTYQFNYTTVKNLVRNSMTYSFLPGKNLWQDKDYKIINIACMKDNVITKSISNSCKAFLDANEKAALQWLLEKRFAEFESTYR